MIIKNKKMLSFLIIVVSTICFLIYTNRDTYLEDCYGNQLTNIADVSTKDEFITLFENCVRQNGESESLDKLDPDGTRREAVAFNNHELKFPLLIRTEGENKDIIYDLFLVKSGYEPYDKTPCLIIKKNCCYIAPYSHPETYKSNFITNTQWCYFIYDSPDHIGKYSININSYAQLGDMSNAIVRDDIAEYAIFFPDGIDLNNLKKIVLKVSDFEDGKGLMYIAIEKDNLRILDNYDNNTLL